MKKQTIGWMFFSIVRQIRRLGMVNDKDLGIGSGRLLILKAVVEHPGISQNELSDEIGVDKTTTAKSVKKLIADNYIYRKKDNKDRRYNKIFPTEHASEMHQVLNKDTQYHSRILLKGFSKNEIIKLQAYLERLYNNLTEEIETKKSSKQ